MEKNEASPEQTQKAPDQKKKIIRWIILGLVVLILGAGAICAHVILNRPKALFTQATSVTASPAAAATPAFDIEQYLPAEGQGTSLIADLVPTPTAVPEGGETEKRTAPLSGIVNIALFGIDAREDGSSTSGTMPHTDTNMIVAVNFDTKEVSLISIARDALTDMPGHAGYYKFNGVFNVGGGMADPKAGFELSSRTAEMWLGGVSVPYYYGLDFQAVIDLVDALGGIDFYVDIHTATLSGEDLPRGQRHLDGEGVLAYLRARRTAGGVDHLRTERQRKMMIAIFRKLKEEGKLSMIPELLRIMGDNVYTNTTLAQTAALVNFAQNIDPDSIHSYGIYGSVYSQFDWRFCFVSQQDRIDILKKVYGIDAEPMGVDTPAYERFLHNHGFYALQHIGYAKRLFEAIHGAVSVESMSEEQKRLYAACWKDYSDLQTAFDLASRWAKVHYDEDKALSLEESRERYRYNTALSELEERLRSSGNALNKAFGSPVQLGWNNDIRWWYEKDSVINEVYVDFR